VIVRRDELGIGARVEKDVGSSPGLVVYEAPVVTGAGVEMKCADHAVAVTFWRFRISAVEAPGLAGQVRVFDEGMTKEGIGEIGRWLRKRGAGMPDPAQNILS
jgi:hypothetical protein